MKKLGYIVLIVNELLVFNFKFQKVAKIQLISRWPKKQSYCFINNL